MGDIDSLLDVFIKRELDKIKNYTEDVCKKIYKGNVSWANYKYNNKYDIYGKLMKF